jgi:hypothetical protein
VRDNEDIRGQLKDLMSTVEALALNKPVTAANIYQAEVCSLCASPMHFTQNCPSLSTGAEYPPEQVNAFNDYRKPTSGGTIPTSLGSKIKHKINEEHQLKLVINILLGSFHRLKISFGHLTKPNLLLFSLPLKCHHWNHNHHLKTQSKHSYRQVARIYKGLTRLYKSLKPPP